MTFDEFYDKYSTSLLRICAKIVGRAVENPDVQDLFSDTIYKVMNHWNAYRGDEGASRLGWATTIARNTFRDQLRSGIHKYETLATDVVERRSDPVQSDGGLELRNVLEYIPDLLSDKLLRVWHLARLGHTEKEMSDIIGIPLGTVKSRLNSARTVLRENFSNYPGNDLVNPTGL